MIWEVALHKGHTVNISINAYTIDDSDIMDVIIKLDNLRISVMADKEGLVDIYASLATAAKVRNSTIRTSQTLLTGGAYVYHLLNEYATGEVDIPLTYADFSEIRTIAAQKLAYLVAS
jgi:hypothetical protein